jgi:hypothetical protein
VPLATIDVLSAGRMRLLTMGPGRAARACDSPHILAGDFNATLDHAQFRRLLRRRRSRVSGKCTSEVIRD